MRTTDTRAPSDDCTVGASRQPLVPADVLASASAAGRVPEPVLLGAIESALSGGPDVTNPGWQDSRACDGPVDRWFPRRGEPVKDLLSTCSGCAVQAPCLAGALARGERDGIWGGTTGGSRRRLRSVLRKAQLLGVRGEDAYITWQEGGVDLEPIEETRRSGDTRTPELWRHQRAAVASIVDAIRDGGRCQVALATASGKTRVGCEAAQALGATRVLVLVPSLPLVAQAAEAWASQPAWRQARRLAVCSDAGELDLDATTNTAQVRSFLETPGPCVLFATYQSSAVLSAPGISVDLAIADEAHHLAGARDKPFAAIVRGEIDAARILFMTATPREAPTRAADRGFVGMDDVTEFGPRVFEFTLSEAIAAGIVADYRVVIAAVERDVFERVARNPELANVDPHLLAGAIAVVRAMGDYRLRGCLSFHTRVDRARDFARLIGPVAEALPELRPVGTGWAGWLHGGTSMRIRRRLLARLADDRAWGVLANAKVLGEGVDVPALDAVAIVDPKNEERDVLQAVGRALRTAPSKSVGTVLLPVLLVGDAVAWDDPLSSVDPRSLETAAGVLRALRAHDANLGARLDGLRRAGGAPGGIGNPMLAVQLRQRAATALLRSRVDMWLPHRAAGDLAGAMALHLIRESTTAWEEAFGLLERWVSEHGTARVPVNKDRGTVAAPGGGTYQLGAWCNVQRSLRRRGLLSPDREARLAALPGWRWDPREAGWWEQFEALADYVRTHKDYPPQHRGAASQPVWKGQRVGQFVNESRNGYRDNGWLTKFPDRVAALEALPGWVWNEKDAEWERHFSQLERFVEASGHADPRSGDLIDGFDIGRWVSKQRSRIAGNTYRDNRNGRVRVEALSEQRAARLRALPGWVDHTRNALWEQGFARLLSYIDEHECLPPQQLSLEDGFGLGGWVATQRERYRRGRLSQERIARLEAVECWTWEPLADAWRNAYDVLRRFAADYPPVRGLLRIPMDRVEDLDLNSWATIQRKLHAAELLAPERAALLEQIPGWTWNTAQAKFQRGLDALRAHVEREGHFEPPSAHRENGVSLRAWIYGVRAQYARGALAADRVAQLEALKGWAWAPATTAEAGWNANWERGYRVLTTWLADHDATTLSSDLVVDGFRLGQWAAKQRSRYAAGTLAQDRIDLLDRLAGWRWSLRPTVRAS
jgi:superfamily II DNA or RNA helicase